MRLPIENVMMLKLDRVRLTQRKLSTRFVLISVLVSLVSGGMALELLAAIRRAQVATDNAVAIAGVQRAHIQNDMHHEGALALVERAFGDSAVAGSLGNVDQRAIEAELAAVRAEVEESNVAIRGLPIPGTLRARVDDAAAMLEAYFISAEDAIRRIGLGGSDAVAARDGFRNEFERLRRHLDELTELLSKAVRSAQSESQAARDAAQRHILENIVVMVSVLLISLAILGRSIRRNITDVGDVAGRIATGDLSARCGALPDDEIGVLGRRINEMARSLETTMEDLSRDRARAEFASKVSSALEMVDSEAEVHQTVSRAMAAVSSKLRMELLLADSSQANLEAAAANPLTGPPGCTVESPFDCVAVRRGTAVVFPSSEALDACPKLLGRSDEAICAVCVPVSFMGRALGVLHATGSASSPPDERLIEQLGTLATATGTRIGTVRAFDTSQRQAATDSLTGLFNRRAFEHEVVTLLRQGNHLAFAMADLDHFKWLNDTHGHAMGDRALVTFAEVLRSWLREEDLVARWGGEEFAIACPGLDAMALAERLEKIRTQLASALVANDCPPVTASFGVVDSSISDSLQGMLQLADAALYSAKAQGRDRIVIGSSDEVLSFERNTFEATAEVRHVEYQGN